MRVILMAIVAAGIIWAATNPTDLVEQVGSVRSQFGRATEAIRIRESPEAEARRIAAYRAWQQNPSYEVETLETLWKTTGHYMVLLHLAEATMEGCGPEFDSPVLEANRDRLRPHDFVAYARLKALKSRRCSQSPTRSPARPDRY